MTKGQKICKEIVLSNKEPINVKGSDIWTDQEEKKGKLGEYTHPASKFGIKISYEDYIKNLEKEKIGVCITGNDGGEYFGALTYHTEASGGVSSGVGTWLMVNVDGERENPKTTIEENTPERKNDVGNDSYESGPLVVIETPTITGAVTGGLKKNASVVIITFFILTILSIIVYYNRKLKRSVI